MIEHHIQKHIITDLVERRSARYGELKPKHIEGNVFTYHLQSLIKQKFIVKNDNGDYSLTNKGKLYGINSSLKTQDFLEQAHAIILLSVRDGSRWLLRKRLVQPLFGKVGFIHGEPRAGESIQEAGSRILKYRTGLEGFVDIKGSGFICLQDKEGLLAYSSFTLLEVTNVKGNLIPTDPHGENIWYDEPDFGTKEMIPSMADFDMLIKKPGLFFLDKSYSL